MKSTKIYTILSSFDRIEQNRLRKYLKSPYFNKNQTIRKYFELLIKNINAVKPKEPVKEQFWTKLFPNEPYDDMRFRKLNSDLLRLVEGFLAQQIYEENPLHKATYLIEAVGKMKLEKLYNSTMKTARRLSDLQLYKPGSYYFYQYLIEKNYYQLKQSTLDRSGKSNVEDIINNLDRFYLSEKMRYYLETKMRETVLSHEYKILFIDEILSHLQKYSYDEIPPISVFYQLFLTLNNAEDESHFFKLKKIIRKNIELFPLEEAKEIYTLAINYCIKKINKGKRSFLEEFLELNEDMLKRDILEEGELSPWKFRNIVTVALRTGQYEWTENFIEVYKNKLAPEYRDNAVTFNTAVLLFYQEKYEKVIAKLQFVEYDDFTYNLNSKAMLLQSYFELDEQEPLYSLMESFRTFLSRKKNIPADRKKSFSDLIRFVKKLSKILPGDQKAITKLKTEVNTTKGIASEKWLHEKIAELE